MQSFVRAQVIAAVSILLLVVASSAQPTQTANPAATSSSSVMIVLDTSQAAKQSLSILTRAADTLAKEFGSGHEVAVMTAGEKPDLIQDFTGDPAIVQAALSKVRPGGSLALYETLLQAVNYVRANAMNDHSAVIALVSDLDEARVMYPGWEERLKGTPAVPVYLIALRAGRWESSEFAQRAAVLSGGAAYAPTKASDVDKIASLIAARLGGASFAASDAKTDKPLRPLKGYSTLLVRDIPIANNSATQEAGGGENLLLKQMLVARLQRAKLFADVRGVSGAGEDSRPAAQQNVEGQGSTLELVATVVGFKRGSRTKRQFALTAPFGGASRIRVQVLLRDRATNETVASFVAQGAHASGLFGGSDEKVQAEAMLEVSNHIVDAIRRMKRREK